MKQKMIAAFLLGLGFTPIVKAQNMLPNVINYQNGTLRIQPFAANIIKLTYLPKGYVTNENVSDAVVLHPSAVLRVNRQRVKIHTDSVFIGNCTLLSTHQTNEFRGFRLLLQPNEMIFGGGERALPLNRRGYRFNLYNNPWYGYSEGADNLNYSVPFFTSSNGYAVFFDNASKGYVDIGKTQSAVFEYGACSGELNMYIITGGNYKSLLAAYSRLTGKQPLPPKWAMGNFMSRFGYTSEAQTKAIADSMRQQNIPMDAIIYDLFWFGDSIKGTLGNLDWVNKTQWPNPPKMMQDFKNQGIKTVLVTEPFVLEATPNYALGKSFLAVDSVGKPYSLADFYFGKGGLIDIFRTDAKDWFWQFYKKQMLNGVDGWWGDLGEPEKHPENLYHNLSGLGFNRLFSANEVHNVYGHNWTKMLFEKYAQDFPNRRLFSLNRSGFAGTQRYGIFPWSGDVSRSWSGLRAQLPIMLGMSMSGIPYIHADAGGFAGGEADAQLYIRWLQFALYTPVFRPHGTALYEVEPQAFSYPSEPALQPEAYKPIAKSIVQKRYAMLPYNYTLAYRQAQYGEPLVRPLYYQFANDTAAANVQDEFMWGENILVAPVLQKNATNRKLYLPEGLWYSEDGATHFNGQQWLNYPLTSLASFPTFVKEGSFIPTYLANTIKNTIETANAQLTVQYFISAKPSSYEWYNDDGVSKNALATHQYQLLRFTSGGQTNHQLTILVSSVMQGVQSQSTAPKNFVLKLIGSTQQPKTVLVNGVKASLLAPTNATTTALSVPIPTAKAVRVTFQW